MALPIRMDVLRIPTSVITSGVIAVGGVSSDHGNGAFSE